MSISRVYTQIELNVSVPWHWNSVNEGSMPHSKAVSIFSLRDVITSVSNKSADIPTQPVIFK